MSLNDLDPMLKADLAFALSEAGSSVVYGSYNTGGVLVYEPNDILQMGLKQYAVLDTKAVLTIAAGSIGAINKAVPILVDGVAYTIHSWIYINDGLEQKLDVSLAPS